MAVERIPAAEASYLTRPLLYLMERVLRWPVATLALAVGLAVLALALTGFQLQYKTSRLDLLNPKSDYNRLWIEYLEEFGDQDDAVVVVEGPSREQVVPVLQEVSQLLSREDRLFQAVLHQVDLRQIQSKGLHYLSAEELQGIGRFLDQVGPIVEGGWPQLKIGSLADGYRQSLSVAPPGPPAEQVGRELERLSAGLLAALGPQRQYQSPWPEMPASFGTLSELNAEYLLTSGGTLGFVLLRLAPGEDGFARGSEATDALRRILEQIEQRHPGTSLGLTGLPVLENDEMRSSSSSMLWASLLSLAGVAVLFVAGFGGVRHALLANLALLIGMAWSFGYLTLAVGHLNILSVSFTVTLIGIGIDYGVHYVACYLALRRQQMPCRQALLTTTSRVGPGIATGALTTAVAFYAAAFTPFTGVAELGLIAGGGILLCAVAELFVLPAAILLVDESPWGQRLPEPLPVHLWLQPFARWPRRVIWSGLALTALAALGLDRLWYDHNLLNLQPEGLQSVQLERKLLAEHQQSVWYALSMADSREELLARKQRLLELKSVERTEEIVSLLPTDLETKQPLIRAIQQRLARLPERPPLIAVDRPDDLGRALAELEGLALSGQLTPRQQRQLSQVRDALRRLPAADCYAVLSQFQQQMAGDLLSRLHLLSHMCNPEPPEWSDLPPSLVQRFVGRNNRYLLKIYGRGDIWDMNALRQFVQEVRGVDPRVTGNPLQAYEASLEMKGSFEQAALYALVIVLVVLWLDFRHLPSCLLAMAPLALGVVQMFGLLGWMDIPLNPANMIALPLVLGIGIDYGVHVVHEYRRVSGPYRMTAGTAVAILVDALTTVVGFGSLMIATHQGLQSLGRVLTIGISCCMITSMVFLPALLAWLSRNRPITDAHSATSHAPAEAAEPGDPAAATTGTMTAGILTPDNAASDPAELPPLRSGNPHLPGPHWPGQPQSAPEQIAESPGSALPGADRHPNHPTIPVRRTGPRGSRR